MMYLRLVLAIAFLGLTASCDSSNPVDPDPGEGDTTYFRIIALSQDTLYIGESSRLTVTDLPTTVDSLRLFIGTTFVPITAISSTDVTFQIPTDASSGTVRLYKTDSILAKGTFLVTVLPRSISSIKGAFTGFTPKQGYEGERVMIGGIDLSQRVRDYQVTIGDLAQPVEYVDSVRMFIRVAPGTKTGPLKVKLFDRSAVELGTFEKLEAGGGKLLEEGRLKQLSFRGGDIAGRTESIVTSGRDTILMQSMEAIKMNMSSTIIDAPIQALGDSLIVTFNENASLNQTIELRLKVDNTNNTASGVIRYHYRDNVTFGNPAHLTEIRITDMRWLRTNTSYMLYAYNADVTDKVTSITIVDTDPENGKVTSVTRYDGGKIGSWIQINMNF